MPDFQLQDGGLMVETFSSNLARAMAKRTGGDPLSYEAHVTFLRAYNTMTAVSRRINPSSLSLGRYNVLRLLYLADGRRLLMSEISEALEVSPTVITRLIDTLVESGHVERAGHDTDKRKTWATMTEAGTALFDEEWPVMAQMVQGLWQGFRDDEKRLLVHLLTKLRLNLLSIEAIETATETR